MNKKFNIPTSNFPKPSIVDRIASKVDQLTESVNITHQMIAAAI
jgi:hypothetical protein